MLYSFTNNFDKEFTSEDLDLFSKRCPDLGISRDDLYAALANSQLVGIAFAENTKKIVGIVQVLSDKKWSAVIKFVHIIDAYQHQGVGTALMQGIMAKLADIPCVYVAPSDMSVASFYSKFGLYELPRAGVLMTEG